MCYAMTIKIKGKKYIKAVWYPDTNDTCLRIAEDVFKHHGIDGNLGWLDAIQKEKCYANYTKDCIILKDTVAQAHLYMDQFRLQDYRRMYNGDDARIIETVPELSYLIAS